MKDFFRQELKHLDAQSLRRSLRSVQWRQSVKIQIDGKELLNFCSNDYLGIADDPRLVCAAGSAMSHDGFGSGASRLVCGNFEIHEKLEQVIAGLKKTEAALAFSCGYMANAGIIPALVGRDDTVFSDRLNHASIVDGIVLSRAHLCRYAHNDTAALEELLKKETGGRRLIVTDTVFSMDGDVAPLREIAALARKYDAWLMVDEAHAFGVLGPTGAGLVEALGLGPDDVPIQMGTLSKAAGSYGAYVAGSAELREYLLQKARSFIFSTALPTAVAAASLEAIQIILQEPLRRERVLKSADTLRCGLRALGFDTLKSETPIIPILLGESSAALRFSRELFERGIFVQAIRPPTVPAGTARLRVTVTAGHSDEDIGRCLEAFKQVRDNAGI